MKLQSRSGFSLVELMVVVAIIGILATIAVPNFQKFQARAKQSSAKSELTGLYTAQKAFYVEYNTYHTNLPLVGFIPDGVPLSAVPGSEGCPSAAGVGRLYRVGFGADSAEASAQAATAPGGSALPCGTAVAEGVSFFAADGTVSTDQALAAASVAARDRFTAEATGRVGSAGSIDTWNINEVRALVNTQNGAR